MDQNFKVCAVMVSFFPDLEELSKNVRSIVGQVDKLIIVDNSDEPVNFSFLAEELESSKIEWVSLKQNLGIGAAHNVGIKLAIDQKFDGILLLDQDSNPPVNLVCELVLAVDSLKSQGIKVACVGPEIINKNTKEAYTPLLNKGVEVNDYIVEKEVLISSGKLIVVDSVKEIGLMDESLFIDLVDFEWCWRANQLGYKCFLTNRTKMGHMVGSKNISILKLYTLLIPAPIRHYYQFRNNILLLKRGYVPMKWKVKSLIERCMELVIYPLFVHPKGKRLKYMTNGLVDGILGRKGKITNG